MTCYKTYQVPICDFCSRYMLDGDLTAISVPDAGVDGAEPSLAEDVANPVSPFKGLARGYADLVLKTCKDVFVIALKCFNKCKNFKAANLCKDLAV